MKRIDVKSDCPINFTVEIFGDAWSLLIMRDMLALGKKTFNEFLESEERIGPSVLASRLLYLEQKGIITKTPDARDRRKIVYAPTKIGLRTIPLVYDLAVWGVQSAPKPDARDPWYQAAQHDKQKIIDLWYDAVQSDSSFFFGPNSVVGRVGITLN